MNEQLVYQEVQYAPWWAMLIFIGTGLVLPILFIGLARLVGKQDQRAVARILLSVSGIVFFLCLTLFVLFGRMTTEVDTNQVRATFGWVGAYSRTVPLSEVKEAEPIEYRPMDYGGWGIRGTEKDRILSQSGDEGVKLQLANGTTLLLGSQQPEKLATVINKARER